MPALAECATTRSPGRRPNRWVAELDGVGPGLRSDGGGDGPVLQGGPAAVGGEVGRLGSAAVNGDVVGAGGAVAVDVGDVELVGPGGLRGDLVEGQGAGSAAAAAEIAGQGAVGTSAAGGDLRWLRGERRRSRPEPDRTPGGVCDARQLRNVSI